MPQPPLQLQIQASIYQPSGGGRLQLFEEFQIEDCSFQELAEILHRFHDLFESIKKARGVPPGKR